MNEEERVLLSPSSGREQENKHECGQRSPNHITTTQ